MKIIAVCLFIILIMSSSFGFDYTNSRAREIHRELTRVSRLVAKKPYKAIRVDIEGLVRRFKALPRHSVPMRELNDLKFSYLDFITKFLTFITSN